MVSGTLTTKRPKKRFELWLPFTASTIGVAEEDLPAVHNKPIKLALAEINRSSSRWECATVYLTERKSILKRNCDGLANWFFPISFRKRRHSNTFGRQWSLSALLHLAVSPPDFVGLLSGGGLFTAVVAQICKWRRTPYYVNYGGWPVPSSKAYLRMMNNAAYVITHTERQMRWMADEGLYRGDNTICWPVGVDTNVFQNGRAAARQDNNNPRLIYVGRITHHKGVLETIQAFRAIRSEFPYATLDVIGSLYDEPFIFTLKNYLKEYALEDSVNFQGAVPYEELPKWYAAADLFIFPSPLESFGFVVVESMACGTPVIALRGSGGPEEIISHGDDGILSDLPNLALEAISLLKSPERLTRMGTRAVEKVNEKYTMEQTVAKLLGLLDSLPAEG